MRIGLQRSPLVAIGRGIADDHAVGDGISLSSDRGVPDQPVTGIKGFTADEAEIGILDAEIGAAFIREELGAGRTAQDPAQTAIEVDIAVERGQPIETRMDETFAPSARPASGCVSRRQRIPVEEQVGASIPGIDIAIEHCQGFELPDNNGPFTIVKDGQILGIAGDKVTAILSQDLIAERRIDRESNPA